MNNDKMILLIDSNHGTYVPMLFAQYYNAKAFNFELINPSEINEDLKILLNHEHEHYWDSWINVLDNSQIRFNDTHYFLSQHDGDLWLIRHDVQFDESGFPIAE